MEQRDRDDSGLVLLCHPWESGADDSPRWDDRCPGGFDIGRWRAEKDRLVTTIGFSADGSPLRNPAFPVASASFNALVAFNAGELASVTGNDGLAAAADELAAALEKNGLTQALFNLAPGDWEGGERGLAALPGREDDFAATVRPALEYAAALGCSQVHALAGIPPSGTSVATARETYVQNIKHAVSKR